MRSFITPAIARLLGPLFWWPRLIRSRPAPAQYRETKRRKLRR
nr:hypothetical protein [Mycobacteroides abscessus]